MRFNVTTSAAELAALRPLRHCRAVLGGRMVDIGDSRDVYAYVTAAGAREVADAWAALADQLACVSAWHALAGVSEETS